MSEMERRRLELFGRLHDGEVTLDKASIYRTAHDATVDENLSHTPPETQFGRAMKQLGVKSILDHSPQEKGPVEHRNAVFQERLVKAMRLKGISDLASANAFLDEEFLADMNTQFNVPPRGQIDLHRRDSTSRETGGGCCHFRRNGSSRTTGQSAGVTGGFN